MRRARSACMQAAHLVAQPESSLVDTSMLPLRQSSAPRCGYARPLQLAAPHRTLAQTGFHVPHRAGRCRWPLAPSNSYFSQCVAEFAGPVASSTGQQLHPVWQHARFKRHAGSPDRALLSSLATIRTSQSSAASYWLCCKYLAVAMSDMIMDV
jgi:hypothetical protein